MTATYTWHPGLKGSAALAADLFHVAGALIDAGAEYGDDDFLDLASVEAAAERLHWPPAELHDAKRILVRMRQLPGRK